MLLDREDDEELIGSNINTKKKQLTTYILDMNAGKREIISKLKTEFTMMAVELGSLEKEGRQDETKRSDISIEYWLKGFMHAEDRKSTRLNSSHVKISYAVFCLKKKTKIKQTQCRIQ